MNNHREAIKKNKKNGETEEKNKIKEHKQLAAFS